jgi:hypothetical protein
VQGITKITAAILVSASLSAHAGFHSFTMHSRANCGGFNESVSWEFNKSYWLLTNSVHINTKKKGDGGCNLWSHSQVTATWRAAAFHTFEAYLVDKWVVYGAHYTSRNNGKSAAFMAKTTAIDCNIYDGWWDV